jgi:hypothetical protein
MGSRFRYEPQGVLRKLALGCRFPHKLRQKLTPSIFDNETGVRLQLTSEEEALIRRLNVRVPGKKEWPLSPVSLDEVANAIVRRRLGYVFEWARISALDTPRTRPAQPARRRAASALPLRQSEPEQAY